MCDACRTELIFSDRNIVCGMRELQNMRRLNMSLCPSEPLVTEEGRKKNDDRCFNKSRQWDRRHIVATVLVKEWQVTTRAIGNQDQPVRAFDRNTDAPTPNPYPLIQLRWVRGG